MCSVLPLRRESLRAWRMARLALRFNTAFLAIATTYSTPGSASRKASNWGCAKPPSRRTRMHTPGRKQRINCISRRKIPTAPAEAVTLPGRNTAAHRYCSASFIEADETHHRQVTPGIVMAVEKRQLLRPMGRIVGRVQIEGDAADTTAQPLGMALHHAGRQRLTQTIEFLGSDGVLKTRQRRLRSQIAARGRIALQEHLVNRIGGQASRIVGVRIAARDREYPLRQKFLQGMIDLARLPLVSQTSGQTTDQSIAAVRGLQQQGSAIGTALPLVKLQRQRLGTNIGEQQTLCRAIVRHRRASLALANYVSATCL